MVITNDYLTLSEVMTLVRLSKSTVYRLIHDGEFPTPFQWAGGRSVRWSAREVEEWMKSRPRSKLGGESAKTEK